MRELAQRGADVNALDRRGQTPLDLAIAAENRPYPLGFDTDIPGASTSEVLKEFAAVRSER